MGRHRPADCGGYVLPRIVSRADYKSAPKQQRWTMAFAKGQLECRLGSR